MATADERIDNLTGALNQLTQQLVAIKNAQGEQGKKLQQTRNVLEKLAALNDLEYCEDFDMWVSKKKLAEFKKDPR